MSNVDRTTEDRFASRDEADRTRWAGRAPGRLRTVLRLDALTCAASGVVCLAAAGPLARLLQDSNPGAVRAVGVVLLVVAVDLVLFARLRAKRLAAAAAVAAGVNVAWVVATAVVVAAGAFDPAGAVLAIVVAAVVAAFAQQELVGAAGVRRGLGTAA